MSRTMRCLSWSCAVLIVVWAVFFTERAGLHIQIVAGAVSFLVCCWGFRLLGDGVAALLFFLVLSVSGVVAPEFVFQGFTTPAFWLVLSGLVIGAAIQETGLSKRMALSFRPGERTSYSTMVLRIIIASFAFAFFVPSAMGRVVILLPVLKGIADDCGFEVGDKGYSGIVFSGVMATTLLPFSILPANLSNLILSGAARSLFAIDVGYMQFLVLHFPVLGICKALILWRIIIFSLPGVIHCQKTSAPPLRWSFEEKYTFLVLGATLLCWLLDSLHGISPGWVSLGAAVLLLLPVPGLAGTNLLGKVRMEILLFIACAIGVGNVIRVSGLGGFITSNFLHYLPLNMEGGVENGTTVLGLFMATGLFTSLPGIPSLFAPLAEDIAGVAHMPLFSLLMLQVLAYSTVILPYQAPPFIVAAHVGRIPYKTMLGCCLLLAVATIFLLFPLDFLWWKFLGIALAGS